MERLCTLNTATLSTRTHLAPKPTQNTLRLVIYGIKFLLKPGPHCRRKVRLSPKTAR